nr:hypothetical protein CFP56_71539 [Quercus suber]
MVDFPKLMKEEGTVTEVMESSLDQSYSLTHRKLNGLNGAVSNGPNQQVVVGLADANGPNGQLSRENFTEQAQSENHLFFASVSPTPTKDTNFIKSQGRGPKKTKIKQLAKGKENRTGVHPKAGMAAIIPRDVDMEIDRAEVGNKRRCRTPLMLILKNAKPTRRTKKRTMLFRFESMWLRDDRCSVVVTDAWERGRIGGKEWPLHHCLEECRASLAEWNKNSFGHVGKQNSELQKKL